MTTRISTSATLALFLLALCSGSRARAQNPPYRDAALPIEARVADLVGRMTLEEKIDQLREKSLDDMRSDARVDKSIKTEISESRRGHRALDPKLVARVLQGRGVGTLNAFTFSADDLATAIDSVQRYLRDHTRLGIPALLVSEGLHGWVQDGATIFPQAIAQGSTFNPVLIEKMAAAIATEATAGGVRQLLAPDLDLAREPRWGRIEETFGEDPYLVSRMGAAYIRGVQQANAAGTSILAAATPKHFVAHGTPSGGLNLAGVRGGENDLQTLYLPPFEAAVKEAGAMSLMNAYSSYDNVPIAASHRLLTDVLRGAWNFRGYIYSDWGSIDMLQTFHHVAADPADAALQALRAGIDLEASSDTYEHLASLVKDGRLDPAVIDTATARVLRVKFMTGLFDRPFAQADALKTTLHRAEHVALAKQIADESIVLLKNDDALLPLPASVPSLAVIGPNADQVQFGDYSWTKQNRDGVTLLQGLKDALGTRTVIRYAPGCDLIGNDTRGFDAATEAARKSAVAIVAVGTTSASLVRDKRNATSGEGFDVTDLGLSGAQQQLIEAVHATGTPTIVVLINGRPISSPWIKQHIPAIVEAWYPGEQGGRSIADILLGRVNPSGKMPVSVAQSAGHLPAFYNHLPSDKGYYKKPGSEANPGRDYVFGSPDALWNFGHGLSYSRFVYSNLKLERSTLTAADDIAASLEVRNDSARDGAEVVQLYVRHLVSSTVTPVLQLARFEKVSIAAGKTAQLHFRLPVRDLWVIGADGKKSVEPGRMRLMIGAASDDIRLEQELDVR
jgi:beta-glucosidase